MRAAVDIWRYFEGTRRVPRLGAGGEMVVINWIKLGAIVIERAKSQVTFVTIVRQKCNNSATMSEL